uniref:Uncharacterized protein n=1 Tax=Timema shepardi TaxID=629360 RepID=A0A7R9AQM8_TIMSH|nr:unnamed protein product [Timema shepardi]
MKRFVKSDKLDSARSLLELGIFNETNLLNAKYVDLGYATREAIRKTKGVSEKEILLFRQDCKTCLQKLCAKLLERSPLKYKLTKAISFLDPAVAVLKSTRSERLKSTLEIVLANNWITGVAADLVDRQFNTRKLRHNSRSDDENVLSQSPRVLRPIMSGLNVLNSIPTPNVFSNHGWNAGFAGAHHSGFGSLMNFQDVSVPPPAVEVAVKGWENGTHQSQLTGEIHSLTRHC